MTTSSVTASSTQEAATWETGGNAFVWENEGSTMSWDTALIYAFDASISTLFQFLDSAPLADAFKRLSDSFSLADARDSTADYKRNLPESLSLADVSKSGLGKAIAEALAWADARDAQASFTREYAEGVSVADLFGNAADFRREYAESFAWADSYARQVSFDRTPSETVGFAEKASHGVAKSLGESLYASDTVAKGPGKVQGEAINFQLGSISTAYNSHLWVRGVTPVGYSLNQNVAGESIFDVRTGPFGYDEVLNVCVQKSTDSDQDGGWNMNANVPIDPNQGTLFAVFMKKPTVEGTGYWGVYSNGSSHVLTMADAANNNPYFFAQDLPNTTDWFLVVGYVHPLGYVGASEAGISGVYSLSGAKVADLAEFKLASGTTAIRHRCYHYYNGVSPLEEEVQYNARPVIIQCSAAEAQGKIAALLADKTDHPLTRKTIGAVRPESLKIADVRTQEASYLRGWSESFALRGGGDMWFDSLNTWGSTQDAWNIPFAVKKNPNTIHERTLAVTESLVRVVEFARNLAEGIGLTEHYRSAFVTGFAEAFAIGDGNAAHTVMGFLREFAEALSLAEIRESAVSIPKSEALGVAEGVRKAPAKPFGESLGVIEGSSRHGDKPIGEGFSVAEQGRNGASTRYSESFSVAETQKSSATKRVSESVALSEALGTLASFNRAISEGLTVAEAIKKAASLPRSEAFKIGDELRRASGAILSDIAIGSGDIAMTDFEALINAAQPTGYGPFRQFMEGDHEYKNAIFRAIISAESDTRPRITSLGVKVDVPDVFDSGTVDAVVGGTTVLFKHNFYEPPQVTVGLKGGTVFAIPKVSQISRTSFKVELFAQDGTSVAGSVSWSAHGF